MRGTSSQWPKNCLNVSLDSRATPKSAANSHQMPQDRVQVIKRWSNVSECSEQNGQVGGPSNLIPLCMSNTFVFNLPSKASHRKNSTFGGAKLSHALQIRESTSLVWDCCTSVCNFFEEYPLPFSHNIPSSWLPLGGFCEIKAIKSSACCTSSPFSSLFHAKVHLHIWPSNHPQSSYSNKFRYTFKHQFN